MNEPLEPKLMPAPDHNSAPPLPRTTVLPSEEQFRLMADSIPQLAWMANGDGWIFWYNRRWYDYTGRTFEQMQGWGWQDVHDPALLPRVIARWQAAHVTREPWEDVFPLRRHDGQMRLHLSRAEPMKDAAGNVLLWFGTNTDIEESVRNNQLLAEARQRLELSLDAAELGTFYCPMPMDRIEWNAKCKEHFWLPPDAKIDFDTFYSILHPDDRARVRAAVTRAIDGRESYDVEYRAVAADGRTRWIRAKGKTYYDPAGQPIRFDGVTLDISDQKRADAALREREAVLQTVTSEARVGLVMVGEDRRYRFANQTYAEILGLPTADIVGRRVSDVLAELYEQIGPNLDRAFAGERIAYELRMPAHPAGGERFYDVVYEPRIGGDAGSRYVVVVITDVTQRKRVEQALVEREAAMREAQRLARVGSWQWDLATDKNIFSDELCRIFQLPVGQPIPDFKDQGGVLYPHESWVILDQAVRNAVETGQGYQLELEALRCGEKFWLMTRSEVLRDAGGKMIGLRGTTQDVTQSRRAVEERERLLDAERQARSDAERASRLKDEFLATLSHELRTPLNAILGWSQILRKRNQLEAEVGEGLLIIERNARAQVQLIEDLLDMSRIISGKLRIDVQQVDLADVIRAAIESVRPAADMKEIRIQTVIDQHVGAVRGDPARLQQVIWNLLSNAIKFTPKAGKVQVALERVNSHIEITVADTGTGITAEFLPHVFERFRQADGSTTRRHGGLGIGLAIVKSVVEAHGGRIRAKSFGENQGTTFSVELPLMVVHDPPHGATRAHPRATSDLGAESSCGDLVLDGVTVLIVDDEQDSRDLVCRVVADCRGRAITAATAAEGLNLVRTERPDVVISDIGMPGQDGYEFIRLIRTMTAEEGGNTPAAALTAFARSEDRRRALIAGYQSHVVKPVEPAELVAVIASLAGKMDRFRR